MRDELVRLADMFVVVLVPSVRFRYRVHFSPTVALLPDLVLALWRNGQHDANLHRPMIPIRPSFVLLGGLFYGWTG